MAIEVVVSSHLVGCLLILGYWCFRGETEALAVWAGILLATFLIPVILSNVLGFAIFAVFHRTALPLPVFIRTCALLMEVSLLSWLVLYLIQVPPDEWRL